MGQHVVVRGEGLTRSEGLDCCYCLAGQSSQGRCLSLRRRRTHFRALSIESFVRAKTLKVYLDSLRKKVLSLCFRIHKVDGKDWQKACESRLGAGDRQGQKLGNYLILVYQEPPCVHYLGILAPLRKHG